MKKITSGMTLMFFWMFIVSTFTSAQQTDTSGYFPLGFWGIWIDHTQPPFTSALNSAQWNQERSNLNEIKGNYLGGTIRKIL
ncbi:MAG TPA: hypothetical protein VLM39_10560 [Ignavibacteriaceae bacterium]|nr:hypothetical protein [Ignavibacteriaceae bacterium]